MNNRIASFLSVLAIAVMVGAAPVLAGALDDVFIVVEKRISPNVDPRPVWVGSRQETPSMWLDGAVEQAQNRLRAEGAYVRQANTCYGPEAGCARERTSRLSTFLPQASVWLVIELDEHGIHAYSLGHNGPRQFADAAPLVAMTDPAAGQYGYGSPGYGGNGGGYGTGGYYGGGYGGAPPFLGGGTVVLPPPPSPAELVRGIRKLGKALLGKDDDRDSRSKAADAKKQGDHR